MRAILALVLSLAASVGHAEETWLCKAWSTGDGSIVGAPFVMTGWPTRKLSTSLVKYAIWPVNKLDKFLVIPKV